MKLTELIAQHITEAFTEGNWSDVSFSGTLKDISLQEATTITNASPNTMARLLFHLTFYNEVIIERIKGNNPFISDANGFDLPLLKTEDEWQQLKEQCQQSASKLAEAIRQFPEEKLFECILPGYSTFYKTFHGVAEHAHYHLGQMVLLKKLIRRSKQNIKNRSSL